MLLPPLNSLIYAYLSRRKTKKLSLFQDFSLGVLDFVLFNPTSDKKVSTFNKEFIYNSTNIPSQGITTTNLINSEEVGTETEALQEIATKETSEKRLKTIIQKI